MDLNGKVEPNWAGIDPIDRRARSSPTPGSGPTVRPIRLEGSLKADSTPQLLGQIDGEVGLDLTMAEAFGVKLSPAAVVLKIGGGQAVFEPIVTTMNDGPVMIQGYLGFDADYGLWLRLDHVGIEGAAINEAVSNSILAYVAPVLARSSGVTGKVTRRRSTGRPVPITANGQMTSRRRRGVPERGLQPRPARRRADLDHRPGRAGPEARPGDGRPGGRTAGSSRTAWSIPIGGNGLRVAIDGSVGFDETPRPQGDDPARPPGPWASTRSSTRPSPGPDRRPADPGTLARPAIDRKALSVAVRNAAKAMGEKELKSEAGRLLDRIAGPNQPSGEPRSKPGRSNPLGDLENLGREILDPKKP